MKRIAENILNAFRGIFHWNTEHMAAPSDRDNYRTPADNGTDSSCFPAERNRLIEHIDIREGRMAERVFAENGAARIQYC